LTYLFNIVSIYSMQLVGLLESMDQSMYASQKCLPNCGCAKWFYNRFLEYKAVRRAARWFRSNRPD